MTHSAEVLRPEGTYFIALEGLSGTGKTETSKHLASRLSGRFIRLTAGYEQPRTVLAHHDYVDARKCLFLSAMMYSSIRVRNELIRGSSVVVDGYIHRTLAYHDGMGAKAEVLTNGAILNPDYSFMLTCDEGVRLHRVKRRAREKTVWDEIESQNIREIQSRYLSYGFPQFDTSQLSTDEVVEQILGYVRANLPSSRVLNWS